MHGLRGAFCRIHHVEGRDGFIVTFGGAGVPGKSTQGHGYRAYNRDLVPTGEADVFYPFGGDAASIVIDDVLYFATGSPIGWRLMQFDALSLEELNAVDFPIDKIRQLENDNLLAMVGGLINASGLHVTEGSEAHREGTRQDGPLDSKLIDHDRGYATHHRLFTPDFELVAELVLDDAPQFFGTSMIELDDVIHLVTSTAHLAEIVAIQYDTSWNHLATVPLGISGAWPQGLVHDAEIDRTYLAYQTGIRGLLNVRIAIFDGNWNLVEDLAVTNHVWEDGKEAGRPWLTLVDDTLYVSYDVMSRVGPDRAEALDNACMVNAYR